MRSIVVIAGMVAERSFQRRVVGLDAALQHDLRRGGYLEVRAQAAGHLGLGAAQQPGEGVLREGVGHRGDRPQDGGRVRAQGDGHREGLPGMGPLPVAKVQGAASVGEPAHDHPVAADHLHAIDAQVLAWFLRSAGHHQSPGDQRARVLGPTGLNRQAAQVDGRTLDQDFLAGRLAHLPRGHVQHLAEHRELLPGVFHSAGRLRLLQEGQQPADLAQRLHRVFSHAQGHPLGGAEQIAEHRNRRALDPLEQQGGSARAQGSVADLGDLQPRVDLDADAPELAAGLELGDKIPKVPVLQSRSLRNGSARNGGAAGNRTACSPP
jgi:hypothetical protein